MDTLEWCRRLARYVDDYGERILEALDHLKAFQIKSLSHNPAKPAYTKESGIRDLEWWFRDLTLLALTASEWSQTEVEGGKSKLKILDMILNRFPSVMEERVVERLTRRGISWMDLTLSMLQETAKAVLTELMTTTEYSFMEGMTWIRQLAGSLVAPRSLRPTLTRWNMPLEQRKVPGSGPKGIQKCHNCGKPGHWKRDCRSAPKPVSGGAVAVAAIEVAVQPQAEMVGAVPLAAAVVASAGGKKSKTFCFKCGPSVPMHLQGQVCPNANRGDICYKCKMEGHRRKDCPNR
jgi:hypothetical protein